MSPPAKRSYLKLVSKGGGAENAAAPAQERADGFPESHAAPWLRACRRLADAGYGDGVVTAYRQASKACAPLVGPGPSVDLADAVSAVAIKAGLDVAQALSNAAVQAAGLVETPQIFLSWVNLMQRFAALAPESVELVLRRTDTLVSEVGVSGLEAWILAGVRAGGGDRERRRAFFAMEDPEAERWLHREAGDVAFPEVERRMRSYLTCLFGRRAPLIEAPSHMPPARRRRPSLSAGAIMMPSTFPGYRGDQAFDIYRAAAAHAGAHLRYSTARFPVGELKPIQIAVVSLIEDARVEALAMREFPGLQRVWLPFHIAQSTGLTTAPSLFARLARALIDPDFSDIDGWVRKGRDMFQAYADRLEDQAVSRHIGNLLGNDLGQMRVQFNAKSYIVQPPYRDDNMGLWRFDEEELEQAEEELATEAFKRREEDEADPPDRERGSQSEGGVGRAASVEADPNQDGRLLARYPEYDYLTGREREDWTRVLHFDPPAGDGAAADLALVRRQAEVQRISALIRSARVSRARRMKRQPDGETLDVDACIEAMIDLRKGDSPDPRVYQSMQRRDRDLSVQLLLDISQSTADRVPGRSDTILDMEREATLMLAHAMGEMSDPFAVAAFASNGREEVRYLPIKRFDEPFDRNSRARLFGLRPGLSTRMGAALRHGASEFAGAATYRRLLMIVTDGEPSDLDCQDGAYLVEDARRAVQSITHRGVDVFCIALGRADDLVLGRIFGRRNVVKIDKVSRLPEKLPIVYLRLTG